MADVPKTTTEAPVTEADPFAAAFEGLSSMKDGETIPQNLDFTQPVPTAKPAATAAKTETAAETTGANAPAVTDGEIVVDEDVEERPVAPTHKEDGTEFTPEEIATAQAALDKEHDDAKAAEAAAAAKKTAPPEDPIERLATTLEKRLAPKPEPAPTPTDTTPKPFTFTAEETEILTAYERDFPDVVRAESLLRKREYHNLLTYIFNQMNTRITPAEQMLAALAQRTHHDDLSKGIDGYSDELLDKVDGWIETQPTFLKTAYATVMENGTAAEVKEVVERFRKETGTPTPTKAATTATTTAPKAADPKTVAAAKALTPVATKRTQVTTTGIAKDDFDAAFGEFAKEEA